MDIFNRYLFLIYFMKYIILIILIPAFLLSETHTENVERAGDILQLIIPGIGLGSTILFENNRDGLKQFCKSLVATGIITKSLKTITQKRRPNGSCCTSFPSGHTSAAFMGAGFIHKRFGWKYSIPAYIGATFVGYSRVEANKHYVEDVIVGATIGVLSSFYFTTPFKNFTMYLDANNGTYNMHISKNF
tara:strand:+ start:2406 stop:2972 length:567 start_codon:yes stop_codon:yes gene_type:complete